MTTEDALPLFNVIGGAEMATPAGVLRALTNDIVLTLPVRREHRSPATYATGKIFPDFDWDFLHLVYRKEAQRDVLQIVQIFEIPVHELGSAHFIGKLDEPFLLIVALDVGFGDEVHEGQERGMPERLAV